jgi:hypothetical protein
MSQTRGQDCGHRRARGQPSEATKNKRLASLQETVNNKRAKGSRRLDSFFASTASAYAARAEAVCDSRQNYAH